MLPDEEILTDIITTRGNRAFIACNMEKKFIITKDYLTIPVFLGAEEKYLEIFLGDEKIFEFNIPSPSKEQASSYDYLAKIPRAGIAGKKLTFKGDFTRAFFDIIKEELEGKPDTGERPLVHFTPAYGWINDPNGLIFDGEYYQLYFQHNPFNIIWNNMSWGHARSKDLITWEQFNDVMFPDERGTIFSGCGLIKDDKFYFPYTVAGGATPWSKGKTFYQGLAESHDGGMTLEKQDEPFLGVVGKDSRDPKIFWHEETSAYIMVLYLEGYDFGVFRSADLKDWQQTQRFSLEKDKGWECPDLLKVPCIDGGYKWMFFCADGFYYCCDFDGYEIKSDWKLHNAYLGGNLYATQSYFGIADRIVAVPWIRTEKSMGKIYQGAMALPKEYSCKKIDDDYILLQSNVRELEDRMQPVDEVPVHGVYSVELEPNDDVIINVNGFEILVFPSEDKIKIDDQEYKLDIKIDKISFLVDYNLLEITISNAILMAYVLEKTENSFSITSNGKSFAGTKGSSSQNGADCNYSIKSFK